jgi:hypothetical protein
MSTETATFNITLSRRIWHVTLDGAFYGDYRSRRHAVESADAAAATMRGQGRVVKIVTPEVTP